MPDNWDAIIVGAGPAGCAVAYDLAMRGRKVLLLDRYQFPRTKACAGALTMKTVAALRYSIKPVVRRICTRMVMGNGLKQQTLFQGEFPICVMTVRSEFDAYCLRQTENAGAEFRVTSAVRAVIQRDDQVVLKTDDGDFRCRFLVGADGSNSRVRSLTGEFPEVALGFALETCLPITNGNPVEMEFDFGCVANGYGWVFPKHDHLNVGLYTNTPGVKISRPELTAYAQAKHGVQPKGEVVGHHIGLGGWRYLPKSKRVFLIGDAAGLVDPLLGEGIYFAIRSGQIAATAIDQEIAGKGLALRMFSSELKTLQKDLYCCHSTANKFYQQLDRGYSALTFPVTRYALMRGFAMGLPFRVIKRTWWTFPFRKIPHLTDCKPD